MSESSSEKLTLVIALRSSGSVPLSSISGHPLLLRTQHTHPVGRSKLFAGCMHQRGQVSRLAIPMSGTIPTVFLRASQDIELRPSAPECPAERDSKESEEVFPGQAAAVAVFATGLASAASVAITLAPHGRTPRHTANAFFRDVPCYSSTDLAHWRFEASTGTGLCVHELSMDCRRDLRQWHRIRRECRPRSRALRRPCGKQRNPYRRTEGNVPMKTLTRLSTLTAALCLTAASSAGVATGASAATTSRAATTSTATEFKTATTGIGPFQIENVAFSQCIDAPGGALNVRLRLAPCSPSSSSTQLWTLMPIAPSTYTIVNKVSGFCMEVNNGTATPG